jgi:hypothetical protein
VTDIFDTLLDPAAPYTPGEMLTPRPDQQPLKAPPVEGEVPGIGKNTDGSLDWSGFFDRQMGRSSAVPSAKPAPVDEIQQQYQTNLERNKPYVKPGDNKYNTDLAPADETAFRDWLKKNNVPFDPNAPVSDYDMRGFYKGLEAGDPKAKNAVDPNDGKIHYPDYWKTPYHKTFSNESQWATGDAPKWNNQDQLVDKSGKVLFDDRAPRAAAKLQNAWVMPHLRPSPRQAAVADVLSSPEKYQTGNNLRFGPQFATSANGVQLDPRLMDVVKTASAQLPEGVSKVELISGVQGRAYTTNHPSGRAIDVLLYDKNGHPIYNEPVGHNPLLGDTRTRTASSFKPYEDFAKVMKKVQSTKYPELNSKFAWGGYFGPDTHGRNAADLMHFDLSGARGTLGNFDTGLGQAGRDFLGIAQ